MPTYVTLYKWTEKGVKTIKDIEARFEASKKLVKSMKSKIISIYVTMGKYDVVMISECPDDEIAATVAFSIAMKGNVQSTTMRAFSESEIYKIVKKAV